MFVGHYAVAFAIKAAEPKTPLWATVVGCQLMDIAWSVFVVAGVEHANSDPSLPGSPFVLTDMPYTHSLPGSLAWSIAWGAFALVVLRQRAWAAALIGFSVFSHWLLDLVVHRPDLPLWFGGPKVGFALWNLPTVEETLEIGLLGLGAMAWTASRKALGLKLWPAFALMTLLIALQLVSILAPPAPNQPVAMGLSALVAYLIVVAASLPLDGPRKAPA